MPVFETSNADTGRGSILGLINTQTEQSARVFIPTAFAKDTALAGPAAHLYVAVAGGNAEIAQATATYTAEALNKYLKGALPALLRSSFDTFRKAIGDYYARTETVRTELATPTPETPVTRPIRDRAVKLYDRSSAADQMKLATQDFDLEQLAGLVAAEALSTLPPDVATLATDRFLALRFAARQALAAKYPVRESADNPVSMSVDNDAMMGEANAFVAAMKANARTVENAIQICRDVITWLAVACQCSTDEAFAMLTAPTKAN